MELKAQCGSSLPACFSASYCLSKKSSKRGLTRRPLFPLRVESLVCTVEMIGPSRSAGAGRDALPRVRRCTSIGLEQAGKKRRGQAKKGCNGLQTRNAGRAGAQPYHVARAATRPLAQRPRLIKSANPPATIVSLSSNDVPRRAPRLGGGRFFAPRRAQALGSSGMLHAGLLQSREVPRFAAERHSPGSFVPFTTIVRCTMKMLKL